MEVMCQRHFLAEADMGPSAQDTVGIAYTN